jgi:hypothetical protein
LTPCPVYYALFSSRSAIKYMAEAQDYGAQMENTLTNAFKGAETGSAIRSVQGGG